MSDLALFRRIWLLIPVLLALAATRSLGEVPLATLPPAPAAVPSEPTDAGAKLEDAGTFDKTKSLPPSLQSLTAKPPSAAPAESAAAEKLPSLPSLPSLPAPGAAAAPPIAKLEPISVSGKSLLPALESKQVEPTDASKQIDEVVAAAKKEMAETAALAKRTINDAALLLKKAGTPAEDPKSRAIASTGTTGAKVPLPPIAVAPPVHAPGSEIAIVLSQDRFYPAEIRVRSGMASTLVFSSVNRRPAALVIEPVQHIRQPSSEPQDKVATAPEIPAEITRELGNDRVTAISFDPARGKYNFHDALGAARGTIIVE